jgi:hypothetical protein
LPKCGQDNWPDDWAKELWNVMRDAFVKKGDPVGDDLGRRMAPEIGVGRLAQSNFVERAK